MVSQDSILGAHQEACRQDNFALQVEKLQTQSKTEPHLVANAIEMATNVRPLNEGAALVILQTAFVVMRAIQIERGSDVDELEMWYSRVGGAA